MHQIHQKPDVSCLVQEVWDLFATTHFCWEHLIIIIVNRADRDTHIPQQLYTFSVSEENKPIYSCLFQVPPMCLSVHEQDTEHLSAPDEHVCGGALHGFPHHWCMNVCVWMGECEIHCKALWERPNIKVINLPLSALLPLMMMTKAAGGEEIIIYKSMDHRHLEHDWECWHQAGGRGLIITNLSIGPNVHKPNVRTNGISELWVDLRELLYSPSHYSCTAPHTYKHRERRRSGSSMALHGEKWHMLAYRNTPMGTFLHFFWPRSYLTIVGEAKILTEQDTALAEVFGTWTKSSTTDETNGAFLITCMQQPRNQRKD